MISNDLVLPVFSLLLAVLCGGIIIIGKVTLDRFYWYLLFFIIVAVANIPDVTSHDDVSRDKVPRVAIRSMECFNEGCIVVLKDKEGELFVVIIEEHSLKKFQKVITERKLSKN